MSKTFINFSRLHTNKWSQSMYDRAIEMAGGSGEAEIVNVAFPDVSPYMTEAELDEVAGECFEKISKYNPAYVMCQGEFTLCFRVVELLKKNGIKAVTPCNERVITEDGNRQIPVFKFVQFREF